MKSLTKGLILLLLVAFTASNAVSQKQISNKVLVTIGDEKVTANEFIKVYEKNNMQSDLYQADAVNEYL
ncbi:MAG: hypothetical protein H8E34_14465, partial [Bacteroidetes bacterium]|nr:hypothetical protein [Bacteroidota bacterium]